MRSITVGVADFLIIALLVAASVIGAKCYVSSEQTFYWSDYLQHYNAWRMSVDIFRLSPAAWLMWLLNANCELSAYYTIANLPFGLVFGTDRLAYILSVILCYTWPFLIMSSLVVAQLFRTDNRKVFWIALLTSGLNPLFWAIPLRGYPDYAASCVLAAAWLIYLQDTSVSKNAQAAQIGMLLGLVPLMRRHFAYPVFASVCAMFIYSAFQSFRPEFGRRFNVRQCLRYIAKFTIAGLYALAFSIILGFNYVSQIVNFNYDLVFKAMHMDLPALVHYYVLSYGLILLFIYAAGWFVAVRFRMLKPGYPLLLAIYATIIVYLWFFEVEMVGLHYTEHFSWLLSIGGTAFFVALLEQCRTSAWARIAVSAAACFLVANLCLGLGLAWTGAPRPTHWEVYYRVEPGQPASLLFSSANAPSVRHDRKEITELCRALCTTFSGKRSLLSVASSSPTFNDELLYDAMRTVLTPAEQNSFPQLTKLPQIDYRDDQPINNLFECDGFIVAHPLQTHLKPDRQTLLRYTVDSFDAKIGLAREFTPVGTPVKLDNGVELTVYKRAQPPTLADIYDSIGAFLPYEKTPHLMMNPWLVWQGRSEVEPVFLTRYRRHTPVFKLAAGTGTVRLSFILLKQLTKPVTVRGTLQGGAAATACGTVQVIDTDGHRKGPALPFAINKTLPSFAATVPPMENAMCRVDVEVTRDKNAETILELPDPGA